MNFDDFVVVFWFVVVVGGLACILEVMRDLTQDPVIGFSAGVFSTIYLPLCMTLLTYSITSSGSQRIMALDLTLSDRISDAKEPIWLPKKWKDKKVCTFLELKNTGNTFPEKLLVRIQSEDRDDTYEIPKGICAGGKTVLRTDVEMSKIESVIVGGKFSFGWKFITFDGQQSKNGSRSVFACFRDTTDKWWYEEKKSKRSKKKEQDVIPCCWGYSGV